MKSWKTTVSGVGSILAGLGTLAKLISSGNFTAEGITAAIGLITGGFGLVFARDNNVSSEDAGAK